MQQSEYHDDYTLTTTPAAQILKTSEGTVRKMADAGILPHIRAANGTRLFRLIDVKRVAKERCE